MHERALLVLKSDWSWKSPRTVYCLRPRITSTKLIRDQKQHNFLKNAINFGGIKPFSRVLSLFSKSLNPQHLAHYSLHPHLRCRGYQNGFTNDENRLHTSCVLNCTCPCEVGPLNQGVDVVGMCTTCFYSSLNETRLDRQTCFILFIQVRIEIRGFAGCSAIVEWRLFCVATSRKRRHGLRYPEMPYGRRTDALQWGPYSYCVDVVNADGKLVFLPFKRGFDLKNLQ